MAKKKFKPGDEIILSREDHEKLYGFYVDLHGLERSVELLAKNVGEAEEKIWDYILDEYPGLKDFVFSWISNVPAGMIVRVKRKK